MNKYSYWKPSIPSSLYEEIKKLFKENSSVKALYNNNPTEFLREAIRDKIVSLEKTSNNSETIEEAAC